MATSLMTARLFFLFISSLLLGKSLACELEEFAFEGTCLEICPETTRADVYTMTCIQCSQVDNSCKTCSSKECIECQHPARYILGFECIKECPAGSVIKGNKFCACDKSCKLCSLSATTNTMQCLECQNEDHKVIDDLCMIMCPIGQKELHAEDSSVKRCVEECPADRSAEFVYNSNEVHCVESCPRGYGIEKQQIGQVASKECAPCHESCSLCSGLSYQDCLECSQEYEQITEIFHLREIQICKLVLDIGSQKTICAAGELIEVEDIELSLDEQLWNCVEACPALKFVYEGKCTPVCPEGFAADL